MPAQHPVIRHRLDGGWATNFGLAADAVPSADGSVVVPWLADASDVYYEFDGGPHKLGGATEFNSSAIEISTVAQDITALFDFWRQGSGGSPSQKLVAAAGTGAGTSLWQADVGTGTFAGIGVIDMSATSVKSFATFDDLMIAMETGGSAPWKWTQSGNGAALSGSPPDGAFAVVHKDRLWMAGDPADPSGVYYSAFTDPEDWTGAGSGRLVFDPNDGDAVTGLVSHKGDLWVFKGPHKGSIHRVTGSAPTGQDPFAKRPFVRGVGAVWHNTIFRYRDDVGFMWNDGSVRSLNAVAEFGDFAEASLSRPIDNYLRERVKHTSSQKFWAKNFDQLGMVIITCAIDGSSEPNHMIVMDYRFSPVRWMQWPAYSEAAQAIEVVVDQTSRNKQVLYGASDAGKCYSLLQPARTVPSGFRDISMDVKTPFVSYGNPMQMKTLRAASVGVVPKGNFTLAFRWRRDEGAFQTATVTQGGGAALGTFVLDTDVLGGTTYAERYVDLHDGGEFRLVQYQIANSMPGEDVEVHTLTTAFKPGSLSLENA